MVKNIGAIGLVYVIATLGWVFLGTTIVSRTDSQQARLRQEVGQLWGTPLVQRAPWGSLEVERVTRTDQWNQGLKTKVAAETTMIDKFDLPIISNSIRTNFELDQRKKGLLWYSTYRVRFAGDYEFENIHEQKGDMVLSFAFPAADGLYDEFQFLVDGTPVRPERRAAALVARVPCEPKARHKISITYASQGLDRFLYQFGEGISEVRNFKLVANTDFAAVDFPGNTVSPTFKQQTGKGWELTWSYSDLISGNGVGIEMPQKLNPGPMASRISFFAPVSLAFFFFLIFIIALLRGIQIHPVNYFFLASAFFAFHLLLAYLVDHVSIHLAFAICSAVSIFLAVSYMRTVVGNRFAFMEVALAQVIYLVGFSYAFFVDGFTGLAVTIGSIVTLFVVMQMTARINWSEKFGDQRRLEIPQPADPRPVGILNSVDLAHPDEGSAV